MVSHSNELSLYPARDHPLAIYEHVLRPLHGREGDHSHSVRVGELGSMVLESQGSPKRKVVTQFQDYLDI